MTDNVSPITTPKTIRASSSQIRRVFGLWLVAEFRAGAKLIILEGLTLSGKTTLTKEPFALDRHSSVNIEMDDFLPASVPDDTSYLDAIDREAMIEQIAKALREPSLVILEGAIVSSAAEPLTAKLGGHTVRRVYLKRMAHLIPDYWADEDFILDPEWWPPTGFHRSIYRYHAENRPWLTCDWSSNGSSLLRGVMIEDGGNWSATYTHEELPARSWVTLCRGTVHLPSLSNCPRARG